MRQPKEDAVKSHYLVGMSLKTKNDSISVDAEDALIAALKVKHDFPQARINFVRKRNSRGDRRHPHGGLAENSTRR
jgi:hypothetical protein